MPRASRNRLAHFLTATLLCACLPVLPTHAQTENVIYSFSGGTDESNPEGGLIVDGGGNLYGVTLVGGTGFAGTVYELSPASGGAWTKTILHSFSWGNTDVALPGSNLVVDAKGNLYGMSAIGGAHGAGGIFELSPSSNGAWTEQVIYSFAGGTDAPSFLSALTIDAAGSLYGYLSRFYSSAGNSFGAVFELEAGSNGTWTEKILHTFSGGNDGSAMYAGQLTLDSSGNLYGMASNGPRDFGIVFELVRGAHGGWSEKIVHAFTGVADGSPAFSAPLLVDGNGNVFGASTWNIFELVPSSNGTWTEKILHTFVGGSDGAYPDSGLTLAASGKIYGTTNQGGGSSWDRL